MSFDFLKLAPIKDHLVAVAGVIGMAVGTIAWLDARYMHSDDIVIRDLMSQSKRYAEIEKFYTDVMMENGGLSESQKKRLKMIQDEQLRISTIVLNGN